LIGFSLTMTPGKIGEVYKCYLVERTNGTPIARTAPIVLVEKMMDAVAFSFLAVVAAALLPAAADSIESSLRTLIIIAGLLLVAAVALRHISLDALGPLLLRTVGRLPLGRRLANLVVVMLSSSADLLRLPVLGKGVLLSLAARTCDGLALTWCAWALGIALPVLGGVLALNSAGALGGLSMLPGGIGVVEASMSVVLSRFGATAGAALAATLAVRLLTLWVWVAIGLTLLIRSGLAADRTEAA
jgi:uncharacterized protein (TIRG00374 family)